MTEARIPNIVVPIDFSRTSERGLVRAVEMAKLFNARLILIHVVDYYPSRYSPSIPIGQYTEELVARRRDDLKELVDRYVDASVEAETLVLKNASAEAAIVGHAESVDAKMIVMGTHGRRGLSRLALGSTAEHVVRHAPCPVMTVGAVGVENEQAA